MKYNLMQMFGRCNFLRFGLRDRVLRIFDNPETTEPKQFSTPFFGGKYTGNMASFIDWSVYYYGAYSIEELNLMRDFTPKNNKGIVVDIGANVGHHTLFAALISKEVLSFEPFHEVAEKAELKIKENQLENVKLHRYALGNENSISSYQKPASNNQGTGSFLHSSGSTESVPLQIRIGDDAFEEIGLHHLNFIKIDVEGFEEKVIRGLKKTLSKYRPVVFFEWSENERHLSESAKEDIFPNSYRFYQFIADTNFATFFRKNGYALRSISKWEDGNILAVPVELAEGNLKSLLTRKLNSR